eukprot:2537915-Rhodomonas_salina.3
MYPRYDPNPVCGYGRFREPVYIKPSLPFSYLKPKLNHARSKPSLRILFLRQQQPILSLRTLLQSTLQKHSAHKLDPRT